MHFTAFRHINQAASTLNYTKLLCKASAENGGFKGQKKRSIEKSRVIMIQMPRRKVKSTKQNKYGKILTNLHSKKLLSCRYFLPISWLTQIPQQTAQSSNVLAIYLFFPFNELLSHI